MQVGFGDEERSLDRPPQPFCRQRKRAPVRDRDRPIGTETFAFMFWHLRYEWLSILRGLLYRRTRQEVDSGTNHG